MAVKISVREQRIFAQTLKNARIGLREAQYEVGLMYAHGMGVAQDLEQAVHWIQKSAERGLSGAQYLLATRYATGAGVEHDDKKATWWFLQAAQQGHAKAVFKLGKIFSTAHPAAASQCIREAAEMDLPEAQLLLGQELVAGKTDDAHYAQAARWYLLAADQGLAGAQCALAELYVSGKGVENNIERALFWYRKAVHQNSPAAQVALEALDAAGLGRTKGRARGRRKPVVTERRQDTGRWDKVIESGDADARYHLGLMYELGICVEQDAELAQELHLLAAKQEDPRAQLALAKMLDRHQDNAHLYWYRKAAEHGCAQAQAVLGDKYFHGQGVQRDVLSGLSSYLKAAEQEDSHALAAVSELCSAGVQHIAVACYRKLAHKGDAQGCFMLGQHYASGVGIEQDQQAALHWWRQAAALGHAQAQCALAGALLAGKVIARDFQKALFWFQKAAEQDDAKAQWNLGSMYAGGGEGLDQDVRLAFDWCQKAADLGFVPAQATLGVLYMRIKEPQKALHWWMRAAEQGDAEAQYNLGITIGTGQGVAQDYTQAFHWFYEAAMRGLVRAQSRVGLLYVTGEGVAMDSIEAHKWFIVAADGGDLAARDNLARSEELLGVMQITEARRRASQVQLVLAKP